MNSHPRPIFNTASSRGIGDLVRLLLFLSMGVTSLVGCGSGDDSAKGASVNKIDGDAVDIQSVDMCGWADKALASSGGATMALDDGFERATSTYSVRGSSGVTDIFVDDDGIDASCDLTRDDADSASAVGSMKITLSQKPKRVPRTDESLKDESYDAKYFEYEGFKGQYYGDKLDIQLPPHTVLTIEIFNRDEGMLHADSNYESAVLPIARALVTTWKQGKVPSTKSTGKGGDDGPLVTTDPLAVCGAIDLSSIPGLMGVTKDDVELEVSSSSDGVSCEVGRKGIPDLVSVYGTWKPTPEEALLELEPYRGDGIDNGCLVDGNFIFHECPDDPLFRKMITVSGRVVIRIDGSYDNVTNEQVLALAKSVAKDIQRIEYGS